MQNSLREIVMPGRRFAMKALHLGLPIIIQNFIMFALNTVSYTHRFEQDDTVMGHTKKTVGAISRRPF